MPTDAADRPKPKACRGCGKRLIDDPIPCAVCDLSFCSELCLNRHAKLTGHRPAPAPAADIGCLALGIVVVVGTVVGVVLLACLGIGK